MGEAGPAPPLPEDLAHAARRRDPERRARTLERRGLLRALAARAIGRHPGEVVIVQAPDGGPRIAGPRRLYASLAGRNDRVIVALGPHPVGVDVERIEPAAHRPLDLLHPRLAATLATADAAGFAHAWCGVEAYLKMLGLGLEGLGEVVATGERAWRPEVPGAEARLEQRVDGGFVHTLAVPG